MGGSVGGVAALHLANLNTPHAVCHHPRPFSARVSSQRFCDFPGGPAPTKMARIDMRSASRHNPAPPGIFASSWFSFLSGCCILPICPVLLCLLLGSVVVVQRSVHLEIAMSLVQPVLADRANLLAVALLLTSAAPASARDIFVNNAAGNDTFNGISAEFTEGGGPVQSISKALDLAKKGDRIVVANTGRPYRESLSVQAGRHSGSVDSPFIIQGNGATLDGSVPVPLDAWESAGGGVFRFRPTKMSHQQLFHRSRPIPRVYPDPSGLAPRPKLEPLQWCLYKGHVYFMPEQGKTLEDYELSNTTLPTGITLYEVRNVRIEDLFVQGYAFDGVSAHDSAMGVDLDHLTCRGNGRMGIAVRGSSRVRIQGCLIGNNGEAQLRVQDYVRVSVENTRLLGVDDAPAVSRNGGWLELNPLKAAATVGAKATTLR